MKLELIGRVVRPLGALGTCGWSPKAWQATYVGRYETAETAFLAANKNWTMEDLK